MTIFFGYDKYADLIFRTSSSVMTDLLPVVPDIQLSGKQVAKIKPVGPCPLSIPGELSPVYVKKLKKVIRSDPLSGWFMPIPSFIP